MSDTPLNDCCLGNWNNWSSVCPNQACSLSLDARRFGAWTQQRVPQGVVSFVQHLRLTPAETRSIIELRMDYVLVHLMIDSRHGCSDAHKDATLEGRVVEGRLPEWTGDNCPRCGQFMRHHAHADSRNCALNRELPHLCVSSVKVNSDGTMRVRVDAPKMPSMWLVLEMPSSWLPPTPK